MMPLALKRKKNDFQAQVLAPAAPCACAKVDIDQTVIARLTGR
jgi:hypothetical protein